MKRKRNIQLFLRYAIILAIAVGLMAPFYWMIITSFKDPVDVFSRPIEWWVSSFDLANYEKLFTQFDGWRYIWNSLRICLINIVGVVLSNCIIAYAMAFMPFKYKKVMMVLMLLTMMIPFTVTFFPQFLLFVKIGWYGTLLPLWVPAFLGNAFYILLLRQYFLTIPQPILDAARVSGCGHFRMLWRVVLPMAKPVLIIMILKTFLDEWSELFKPLIYILKEQDKTFPVLLTYLESSYGNTGTLPSIMAGGILSAIPALIVYFIAQKNMIKAYVFRTGDE
ncbi:MAG: carbohydrate ABC transporter permease [Dehalococcoidales bacterium]|nr:carbohydrate ABC transporter permease [Dehalococcoidales bacterium]